MTKGNGWRTVAIVFIVLFIIETMMFVSLYNIGTKMMDNEMECNVNICEGYQAFIYDDFEKVCYCYEDGEVAKTEFIR